MSEQLSAREQQVAILTAQGNSPEEIAAELGCSTSTVKTHQTFAYRKLRVHSMVELFKVLFERGLIELPEDPRCNLGIRGCSIEHVDEDGESWLRPSRL